MSASFLASAKAAQTASVLRCGRAGERWREDLTRSWARLDNLRRLCSWVEPLVHHGTWTGEGSLFGNCLEECTTEGGKNARRGLRTQRPREQASPARESDPVMEKKG